MPAMPRYNEKATKIAYRILGTPENMIDASTPKQKKVKKQLTYDEGQWAR